MARIRSVDFLPEIYQTTTNKKFLGSTLDQLIQEPKLKATQGYIGRRSAAGYSPNDGYVIEPTAERTNYQLEPGVVFNDANQNPVDALSYTGLIDGLQTTGANVDNHDRLFRSDTYSWSPFIDFDKFVNYGQYFWLPQGPDNVSVSAESIATPFDFNITREVAGYNIEEFPVLNPVITLVRGQTYTFNVSQTGHPFYIQSQPGVSGTMPWADNISSREVLGVTNNGEDDGTVTFTVPPANAQDFYHTLIDIGNVDIATDERFDSISNQLLSVVESISGVQDIDLKTIVFLNDEPGTSDEAGWKYNTVPETYLDTNAERYQIFQIVLDYTADPLDPTIVLNPVTAIANFEKITIQYGHLYSNIGFFKNAGGFLERIPVTTSSLDTLYYQDGTSPDLLGVINVVNVGESPTLNIDDIIGQETYTSPNGVKFTNGLKVLFIGNVNPEAYTDEEFFVDGVGTAIKLVPVISLITPERYSRSNTSPWDTRPWDSSGWDGTLNAPIDHDYLTINRSSQDINAWSRSNRWFHIDVILQTAEHNNVTANLDNNDRAKRPILEFDANLSLFDYGSNGKTGVNIIDFETTDAFSDINGTPGTAINPETGDPEPTYIVDGFGLLGGNRVIFAADTDLSVRNKIYVVELVDINNDGEFIISLVPAVDTDVEINDVLVVNNGDTQQGNVYSYDGTTWELSQQKISVNQAPLFDMYDIDEFSLSEQQAYPSTSFVGTKLFSYAEGTAASDPILGFPLKFLNIDNLGDIVFDNNLYSDRFSYVLESVSYDKSIGNHFARKYINNIDFTNETGWVNSIEEAHSAQILRFVADGQTVTIDVEPKTGLLIPPVSVTIDNVFVSSADYTVSNKVITFNNTITVGSEIEVKVISDDTSVLGYYQIPCNLSSNIFNENTSQLTLGTVRNHYNELARNILDLEGDINGANNSRDLGDISVYGNVIVQQSAPVALTAMFLRKEEYNFFNAVTFNSRHYEKLKNQILEWVAQNDIFELTSAEILDKALTQINANKDTESSFYWSDMLPIGTNFETTVYDITAIATDTFSTINSYDFTQANNQALMLYYNGLLLTKDTDYTVAADGPRITLLFDTTPGDVLIINEYESTAGSNIPSTPTKLGLYPKFVPSIYPDDTYTNTVDVIRGHDGSITIAAGDASDDVLLEFEKRIYNNIKVNDDIPVTLPDVVPGEFRETDYTDKEITEILSPSLLAWLGWNRIDFKSQEYDQTDEKTWNYSSSGNKLSGNTPLKGHWRGVYNYFYDTDAPHERPWEMLGLKERPDWWVLRYGPAPYTAGNLVLWDDLEAGILKDPDGEVVLEKFKRPGLTSVLPVDDEGILLMPLQSVIGDYIAYDFKKSWAIGDQGPAESAWRKSSAFPYAVQTLLALTKPAQYFALMADRDRYTYDDSQDQYLYDNRHRLDSRSVEVADTTLIKHSYINWIVDYNKHFGFESTDQLVKDLANMGVNLVHHMASFTDKNNLKIFTDKSSPDSTNNSLLLPDESYNLLLYKNQIFDEIIYSSVIVQELASVTVTESTTVIANAPGSITAMVIGPSVTVTVSSTSGL